MKLAALLALCAVVVAAVCAAPAHGAEPVNKEAAAAAIAAGEAAGRAAGAKAGNQTGAQAGKRAAAGEFAEKMTPEQYKVLAVKNTGAAQFFSDFDKDGNHHWSKAEFEAAIRGVVQREILPANYNVQTNWAKLPKNVDAEINFRDFLSWAATMKARPPPAAAKNASAAAKPAAAQKGATSARDCKSLFHKYDKDSSNTLTEEEFRASMQGRYDDSKLGSVYTELDRKGAKGTLAEVAFVDFCAKLTGMPRDAKEAGKGDQAKMDPCAGDPCAKVADTVCKPDVKKCVTDPCPQYRCVKVEADEDGGKAGAPKSPYSKCVQLFDEWDNNGKDKQLTYAEFERGVAKEQAAGRMPATFKATRAWEALEHEGDMLDVYEFVHFCLAQSSQEQDADTVDQECFEVFSHWDRNPRDLTLSGREFWKGMRRAQRQGHLPASTRIRRVWRGLPKVNGEVEPGPFVDFCREMSRGADPEAAAKDTQAPAEVKPDTPDLDAAAAKKVDEALKQAAAGGNETAADALRSNAKVEYKPVNGTSSNSTAAASNATKVDNVGHAAKVPADMFCAKAFHKADSNGDQQLTASEFKFGCAEVVPGKACDNYTEIFTAFDSSGKQHLTLVDFVRLCKASGNKTAAGSVSLDSAYLKKLAAGADAGARAGARAGAEAGRQAGLHAGLDAAQRHHLDQVVAAAESSASGDSSEDADEGNGDDGSSSASSGGSEDQDGGAAGSASASNSEPADDSTAKPVSSSDESEESSSESAGEASPAEESTEESASGDDAASSEEAAEETEESDESEEAEESSAAATEETQPEAAESSGEDESENTSAESS